MVRLALVDLRAPSRARVCSTIRLRRPFVTPLLSTALSYQQQLRFACTMATLAAASPSSPSAAPLDPAVLASRRVVFVGGCCDDVGPALVRAALIPFGPIRSVDMPVNYGEGRHRGFAFVEFEEADDAEEAAYNMDGAELLGRTISVSLAQPNQVHKLTSGSGGTGSKQEAIWKSDEWFQQQMGQPDEKAVAEQQAKEADVRTLQET
jgi:peptidyl-prolyl isomerase E (cyclophilin E)